MQEPQTTVVYESYPKIDIREFLPELTFEFSEMPESGIPFFLLRAVQRMARTGNILRRTATIHAQNCVENYLIEPTDCMDIVAIMNIQMFSRGCCMGVHRLTHEPQCTPCGIYSWYEEPNVIHISPARDCDVFKVTFSVAPTQDACEVDRKLYTNFYDTVIAGAKFYLYSMMDKPWSSVNRAQEYERRFLSGIRVAALETLTGGQRGGFRATRMRVL